MRAITVLCTIVALFVTSTAALAGCVKVTPPPVEKRFDDRQLQRGIPGYKAIRVAFTTDRTDATKISNRDEGVKMNLGEEKFRFWIQGHVNVLFDRLDYVRAVYHCTLGAGKTEPKDLKTFVEVRYKTIPNEGDNHSGWVGLMIPQAVADARPEAGITYDSGNELGSRWETTKNDKGIEVLQLSIAPIE